MKKLTAIILAVILVMSLATVAMAADTTGKITVENAVVGQTYKLYQLAVLESYAEGKYSYKPVTAWTTFFEERDTWFTINDAGYLLLNDGVSLTADEAVTLSKDALAYAKENSIDALNTVVAESTTLTFDGLALGYYLLDSSIGTLCTLDTGTSELTISDKNAAPVIGKLVQEDSKENNANENYGWGETNDADFFQEVKYRTTITAQAGAQNYVVHDEMDAGLTLDATSVQVTLNDAAVAAENYSLVTENLTDGCTFHVVFQQSFCDTLQADDEIVVAYSAALNENAVIAGNGNVNKTWMTYGESAKTPEYTTTTYVYELDVIKTDAAGVLLSGAQFKLYDAATGGNEIAVVKEADGNYRVAKTGETSVAIEVAGGKTVLTGLDGGTTYYLEETVAPDGYNKLTARKAFEIASGNLTAEFDDDSYVSGGVQIVNKTGAELPETGGVGTLLFTLLGGSAVLGSGVLLVTKKRMSRIEE